MVTTGSLGRQSDSFVYCVVNYFFKWLTAHIENSSVCWHKAVFGLANNDLSRWCNWQCFPWNICTWQTVDQLNLSPCLCGSSQALCLLCIYITLFSWHVSLCGIWCCDKWRLKHLYFQPFISRHTSSRPHLLTRFLQRFEDFSITLKGLCLAALTEKRCAYL